jgi:hypothetical protein
MSALEEFLRDNPKMADQPHAVAPARGAGVGDRIWGPPLAIAIRGSWRLDYRLRRRPGQASTSR